MNLATEGWIPVLHMNGERKQASLREVFLNGNEYADLAVRPHERIALMRLLICIAQAALDGPTDIDEWDEAPAKLPEAVNRYLEKKKDYFKLFDDKKPFLQISKLERASDKTTLVSKMEFNLSSGTGQELFDHGLRTYGTYETNDLPLLLVTYLNFSTGGGLPVAKWETVSTKQVGNKDAPCVSASMYHTFVRGKDVLETLCSNLLTKDTVKNRMKIEWGQPVWEKMPSLPTDQSAVSNATITYLGRLVPLSRWIKLENNTNNILCCNGFDYISQNIREPSATLIVRDEKRLTLSATTTKSIWRDMPSLILKRIADDSTGGAITLQNIPADKPFDIYVGALIRKAGQQDIIDMVESVFHIPASMNTDAGRAAYEDEVRYAESFGKKLYSAVNTYFKHLHDDWEEKLKKESNAKKKTALRRQLQTKATHHFWTAVEKHRPLLMEYVSAIGSDVNNVEESLSTWRKAVHKAMREAYILACGRETSRQIRAFAMGWAQLFAETPASNAATDIETENTE